MWAIGGQGAGGDPEGGTSLLPREGLEAPGLRQNVKHEKASHVRFPTGTLPGLPVV